MLERGVACYLLLSIVAVSKFVYCVRYFRGIRNYILVNHMKGTETYIWCHLFMAYDLPGCVFCQMLCP